MRVSLTILNGVYLLACLGAVIFLWTLSPNLITQGLITLIGPILGAFTTIFIQSNTWWFGSSKGSSDKTDRMLDAP